MASHRHSSARPDPSAPYANSNVWLIVALLISLALHATVLAIHFVPPESLPKIASSLEVVLVNARSTTRPDKPKVAAQHNLDGGGNTDQNVRPTSPLPPQEHARDGDALIEASRRQQTAPQPQPQQTVITRQNGTVALAARPQTSDPNTETQPVASGVELYDSAAASMKETAEIDRKYQAYAQRPKKRVIGTQAIEERDSMYVEAWRQKIERIGEINYPEAARGKIYGSLQLQVTLDADGNVKELEIIRSSGHKVLDEAAKNIVNMGAPYARFPPEIKRDTDLMVIPRTWTFTNQNKLITRQ
jgi:protein TonB